MTSAMPEMGIVQTPTYVQKDAGGYWFYKNWGKTSADPVRDDGQIGQMPISWNWAYQLNQYELCFPEVESCAGATTASHRLSWGTNYGAVGGDTEGAPGTYPSFGDDKRLVGFPYQSYSVFAVLGKHTGKTVLTQAARSRSFQKTTSRQRWVQSLPTAPAALDAPTP